MLRPGLEKVAFARVQGTGNAGLDVISGLNEDAPPKLVLFPVPAAQSTSLTTPASRHRRSKLASPSTPGPTTTTRDCR